MTPWWMSISRTAVEEERDRLADVINAGHEQGLDMDEMCGAYQALMWVLKPDNHAPPHEIGLPPPRPNLKVIK